MSVKRVVAGLIAVVALLAMSGCSANRGSVAAKVGDQVLSQSALDREINVANEKLTDFNPVFATFDTTEFVLKAEIMGRIMTSALAKLNVTITDQMRNDYITNTYSPSEAVYLLWNDKRTKSAIDNMSNWNIGLMLRDAGMVDGVALSAQLSAISKAVKVNPRYGDWDMSSQTVASRVASQLQQGALAEPAAFTIPR